MKIKIVTILALMTYVAMPVSLSSAQSAWDGSWRMKIEYSKRSSSNPTCSGYLFPDPFVVKNGRISGTLRHDKKGAIFLSGTVTADGTFTAKGAGNIIAGDVIGTLTKNGGKGTWKEINITFCDGTWTAIRK